MFKKVLATVLTVVMLMSLSVVTLANEVPGQEAVLRFEIENPVPFVASDTGYTMLPLRIVAEALGADVSWVQETRTVYITKDGIAVFVPVDEALPGGMGRPVVVEGRVFVPLNYVAQALNVEISWDSQGQAIYVSGAPQFPVAMEPGEIDEPEAFDEVDEPVSYTDVITAYELFTNASESLAEAASILMHSEVDMTMVLDGLTMDITMTSEIAQVIRSATDIDMRMESTATAMGMTMPSVIYFRNGMYYIDMMGMQSRVPMPLEEVLEQTGLIEFPEDAIISQAVMAGDLTTEVTFTLSGYAMESFVESLAGGMFEMLDLGDLSMSIGDIEITAILDSDGFLSSMLMNMTISMMMEGVSASTSMNMRTEVLQVGGVTVDFPDYLDDFPDFDMAFLQ